jgi:hypothetical protein
VDAPQRGLPVTPVARLRGVAEPFVKHRQVVRGEKAAAADDAVLQRRTLADLERAQPARFDHRQQHLRMGRLGRRPAEQQIADREEEVGRPGPARDRRLGQPERLLEPGQALQRVEPAHDPVVPPGRIVGPAVGLRIVKGSGVELVVDLVVLAELVAQVRIVRLRREGELQQPTVAAALAVPLRRLVAVVPDRQRETPARQRRRGLLVHPALVAHAPRQQPREPARRALDPSAVVLDQAHHVQLADEARFGIANRSEALAAVLDPLVGIEDQAPVGVGQRERRVAGRREIVDPREMRHACAAARRDRRGVVDRAGVEHDHLVDPGPDALQAAFDRARFVACDQHQRDAARDRAHDVLIGGRTVR